MITFTKAKSLAENEARAVFSWAPLKQPYLSDMHIEREYCWIFFAHESTPTPAEGSPCFTAYAVSKKGNVRDVYDFRDDEKNMTDFANKMSDYFFRNDE